MAKNRRKRRSPFAWLLWIPAKILFDVLFFTLGLALDVIYWNRVYEKREAEGIIEGGHGVPVITLIFLMIIAVTSVIVLLVSVIGTCVRLYLRSRAGTAEEWEALQLKAAQEDENKRRTVEENENGLPRYEGNEL